MSIEMDPFLHQRLYRFRSDLVSVLHFVNSEHNAKRMSGCHQMYHDVQVRLEGVAREEVKKHVQNVHSIYMFS